MTTFGLIHGAGDVGRHWHLNQTPNPGGENILYGVDAVSSNDAWTVGYTNVKRDTSALIAHWDGRSWRQVASPDAAGGILLADVAARFPSDVWAVGGFRPATNAVLQVLAVHCC